MNHNRPIGLYDSGIGGLSVVREVFAQMPFERVVYFGDTARVPYGSRSAAELLQFNREILRFMLDSGVKMVLVACNTSCAVALPALRAEFPVPILGLIEAGAQAASGDRIGVIATEATIRSGAYDRAIHHLSPDSQVIGQACPSLVPLVESGRWHGPEAMEVVREALAPLMDQNLDTLILGCTHFPHLAPLITRLMPGVRLVDPARNAVLNARHFLSKQRLLNDGRGENHFFVSGDPQSFERLAHRLFSDTVGTVEQVRPDLPPHSAIA